MRYLMSLILGLSLLIPVAHAADLVDGKSLLQKVDQNLAPESYEAYRKFISIDAQGKQKEFNIYSIKNGRDKMVALFLSPTSDKGRTTLRLGDNMWLYSPNVGRPIRIKNLQSITGGIFKNADIMQLDYTQEYDVAQISDHDTTWLFILKAKNKNIAYQQLKMTVDKALLLPTKVDAYINTGTLTKTMYFKDVKDFGNGIKRPSTIEIESPRHQGYQAVITYEQLKKRKVSTEVFSLGYLPRVGELRSSLK